MAEPGRDRSMVDLTEGNIPRHLIRFSIPMLLGNLLQALYNTVDSIWVGRFVGPEALGAVSISFPIIFALVALVMGITMATTTMVAQYAGAKQYDMVRKTINNSILVLILSGLFLTGIGLWLHVPILRLINAPEAILPMASSYLSIFLGGMIFMFGYNVLGAILRGLGDSRTPLKFLFVATVVNIVLDPFLIIGIGPFPQMGVAGAALATVISQGVATVLALNYLNKKDHLVAIRWRELKYDAQLTRTTVRIGLPAGIQQTVVALGGLAVSSMINSFGPLVVAAYGAAMRLDQFAFMPSMSIGLAVSSLVGQNMGAGREDRVRETVRWGSLITTGITGIMTLVAVFRPQILLVLFTTNAEVIANGSQYLRIVGLSYIPFALMFVITGALRGAGDTIPTMAISITTLWLVRIPLARYLSSLPNLGVQGIWMAIAISSTTGMILARLYYATGRWKNKAVVRSGPVLPALDEKTPETAGNRSAQDLSSQKVNTQEGS